MGDELEGRLAPYGTGLAALLRERLTPGPSPRLAVLRPARPRAAMRLAPAGGMAIDALRIERVAPVPAVAIGHEPIRRDVSLVFAIHALLLLAIADWATTIRLVPAHAREANPVARALLDHGVAPLLLAKVGLIAFIFLVLLRVRVRAWIVRAVWIAVGAYGAAVALNLVNLARVSS